MNRGYVRTWRCLEDSAVFPNEGLLKVFLWCLFRANYQDTWVTVKTGRGFTEVKLLAGSFIFGRESAAKKLHMSPSTVWKRILKLKKLEILNIESNSHYSIISIVNWHIYQSGFQDGNSGGDRQGTGKEHREELKALKKERNPREIFSQISALRERYPDQEIINQVFDAISSTRKTGKIADNVKLSILRSWVRYPIKTVLFGIQTYLDKGCGAAQGKNEKYLLGIIRNLSEGSGGPQKPTTPKVPVLEGFICPRCGQEVLFEQDLTSTGCIFCDSRRQA